MNNKPNIPGEMSWRMDWQVNGWLLVAALISVCSDMLFARMVDQWPISWRVGIVSAQFLAIGLWVPNFLRWISGMDEMHRRVTLLAALFAIGATFFFVMLWHQLDALGLFTLIFLKPKAGGSWDICTVGHVFLLMTLFYFVGHSVLNRRYQ